MFYVNKKICENMNKEFYLSVVLILVATFRNRIGADNANNADKQIIIIRKKTSEFKYEQKEITGLKINQKNENILEYKTLQ